MVLIIAERLKLVRPTVAVIAFLSFVLCVAGTSIVPSATFYLLPTRAWELMLGALIAVGAVRIPANARQVSAFTGLTMLVVSAAWITKASLFPGWIAAVPAVGAMLIIGSGPLTYVNRAIANKLFIGIGKVSYSLYLWHWPVFAFMRHYRADPALADPLGNRWHLPIVCAGVGNLPMGRAALAPRLDAISPRRDRDRNRRWRHPCIELGDSGWRRLAWAI